MISIEVFSYLQPEEKRKGYLEAIFEWNGEKWGRRLLLLIPNENADEKDLAAFEFYKKTLINGCKTSIFMLRKGINPDTLDETSSLFPKEEEVEDLPDVEVIDRGMIEHRLYET